MTTASPKLIVRGARAPKNVAAVVNSDPRGRKHDNVPPEYFGPTPKRGRGLSMSGLRPSFFAMMKRAHEPTPKGD